MVEGGLLGRVDHGREDGAITLAGLSGGDLLDAPLSRGTSKPAAPADAPTVAHPAATTPVEVSPRPGSGAPIPPVETARPGERVPPAEAPPPEHLATVDHGVLKAQFGDKNLDETLARKDYTRIELQVPANVDVQHFVDQNGYYFWLRRTTDGPDGQRKIENADGQRHYYPTNAQEMCVNGSNKAVYLEAQRLQSNEALANKAVAARLKEQGKPTDRAPVYFEDLNRAQATNPLPVAQFASRVADISGAALAVEEKTLSESVQNYPSNPYFKIYLSDIYLAQATKPMIEQIKAGQSVGDDPQARQRIEMALNLLNDAVTNSRIGLPTLKGNKTLPGNVSAPLSPYDLFKQNDDASRNAFFSGSFDQATRRTEALTMIKNMINTQSWAGELKKAQP
jgi:hypothetical protein